MYVSAQASKIRDGGVYVIVLVVLVHCKQRLFQEFAREGAKIQ